MRYHRTPPQKSFFAYLMPFLILIILGLIVFMLVRFFNNVGDRSGTETSYASMKAVSGEAKVKLWGSEEWSSVPQETIILYEGDSIRALPGGKVKMSLFDKHTTTLNGDSELMISELRKENQTLHTTLKLNQGEMWVDVNRDINPNSTFLVKTDALQISTKGATFDVEPAVVRVIKGEVDVEIYYEGATIVTEHIGVGQELTLNDAKLQALANNVESEVELVSMLSDEFKMSNWYLYNTEGKIVTSTVEDGLDDLIAEDEFSDEVEEIVESTNVSTPQIITPVKNGGEYKITGKSQRIEGTAGADVVKVVVNDYALKSLKDGKWYYNADVKYGNLEKGENVYEVYAEDAEGNKSAVAKITLIYGEAFVEDEGDKEIAEVADDKERKTTEVEEDNEKDNEPETENSDETTDELKITAPNDGEDFTTSETVFLVTGTAPSQAAKVVVSGYTLTSFSEGDKTWSYNIHPKYNNITAGEDNTYKVVAYDKDGKVIATAELVITVEESAEGESGSGEVME